MKRRKLITLLKQQGFTERTAIEGVPNTYYITTAQKNLLVTTQDGSSFLFGGEFSGYEIGSYHIDIALETSTLMALMCLLFGKGEPSPDGETLRMTISDTAREHFCAIV